MLFEQRHSAMVGRIAILAIFAGVAVGWFATSLWDAVLMGIVLAVVLAMLRTAEFRAEEGEWIRVQRQTKGSVGLDRALKGITLAHVPWYAFLIAVSATATYYLAR